MNSKLRKSALGSAVALALLGGSAPAFAVGGVMFCATGNSCNGILVENFSWQQVSVVANEGFNNLGAGTVAGAQMMGQGWLTQLQGPTDVSNDNFLFVFSVDVSVTKSGNASGDTVAFVDGQLVVPTAVTATNYFRIYHNPGGATTANFNAGLPSTGAGSLILEGTVFLDDNPNITDPNKTDQGSGVTLGSQTPADIGPGTTIQNGDNVRTVRVSNGSILIDINVLSAESAYFRTDIKSLDLDLNLSGNIGAPFTNVQVPDQISGEALDFGGISGGTYLNNTTCEPVGAVTNAPCDMIYAANGGALSAVFAEIPEPGTLAMLGLGLLGLGSRFRRK